MADTESAPSSGWSLGMVVVTSADAPAEESSVTDSDPYQLHGPILPCPFIEMSAKRLPTCGRYLPTFVRSWQGGGCSLLRFPVDHLTRLWGISVTADQQAAGAVMKVLAGPICGR